MKLAGMRVLAAMITLFASLPAWGATLSAPTTTDITPYAPTSAAFADFNRDGNQDTALVLSNGTSHYLRIMTGDGLGGFSSQSDLALPDDLASATVSGTVVAADFNGNGFTDLAVSNTGADCVSIFLGDGNGGFTKVTPDITVGAAPKAIAVGDFKGDGSRDDIAVVNSADMNVSILLNDGTGTMTVQGTTYSSSPQDAISAIAAGDYDGDDIDDIAITRNSAGKVTFFMGNGVGTFAAGTDITVGTAPVALAAADLNSDGITDLAALNSTDATVSILKGNKSGIFSASTGNVTNPADNTANPLDILATDLNRDGVLDLVVASNANSSISVMIGKGDATFTAASASENFATGAAPTAMASGDLNAGGNDLLSLSSTNTSYSILLNGSAAAAGLIVTPGSHDFGKMQVGHAAYFSTLLSLANGGSAALNVDSMSIAGGINSPFQVVPQYGSCGTASPVIAAGSSCTVEVRFVNPITEGSKSDTLTIAASNATNNPNTAVPLSGTIVSSTTPYTVTVSFLGRGSGTVTFSSGDASCTTDCGRTPPEAGTIALTPVPDTGSFFYGWTGCDSVSNGTCTINQYSYNASDRNLSVNYGAVPRRIKVEGFSFSTYASTARAAYGSAGFGDKIKMPAGLLDENLIMDKSEEVELKGGYDSGFTTQGEPTILRSITVAAGTAYLDNIVLQ